MTCRGERYTTARWIHSSVMPELVALAAVAEDGTIGDDGEMPWHYPADLNHFREITMGHPIVMGRRTWESLPSALDGRTNLVLSESLERSQNRCRPIIMRSIEEALDYAETFKQPTYVVGGVSVYEQMLPDCSRVVITRIPEAPDGDAKFPELDDSWHVAEQYKLRDGLVVEEHARA